MVALVFFLFFINSFCNSDIVIVLFQSIICSQKMRSAEAGDNSSVQMKEEERKGNATISLLN